MYDKLISLESLSALNIPRVSPMAEWQERRSSGDHPCPLQLQQLSLVFQLIPRLLELLSRSRVSESVVEIRIRIDIRIMVHTPDINTNARILFRRPAFLFIRNSVWGDHFP